MKTLIIIALAAISTTAFAGHVNGYYRSNGTYVQPYERSNANGTARDNYSYSGNVNPYTGRIGTSTKLDQGDYGYSGNSDSNSTHQSSSNCDNFNYPCQKKY